MPSPATATASTPNKGAAIGSAGGRDVGSAVAQDWARVAPHVDSMDLALVNRTVRLAGLLEESLMERLRPLELTRAEFHVLTTLRAVGPPHELRPADLADRVWMTTGGVSNLLRRLTARDLVVRQRSTADRRSITVRLTDEGADLAMHCMDAWGEAQQRFFRGVPATHRAKAADALAHLLADVDTWQVRLSADQ